MSDYLKALEILLVGWGGIFIVMAVLFLVIKLLLRGSSPKNKNANL